MKKVIRKVGRWMQCMQTNIMLCCIQLWPLTGCHSFDLYCTLTHSLTQVITRKQSTLDLWYYWSRQYWYHLLSSSTTKQQEDINKDVKAKPKSSQKPILWETASNWLPFPQTVNLLIKGWWNSKSWMECSWTKSHFSRIYKTAHTSWQYFI